VIIVVRLRLLNATIEVFPRRKRFSVFFQKCDKVTSVVFLLPWQDLDVIPAYRVGCIVHFHVCVECLLSFCVESSPDALGRMCRHDQSHNIVPLKQLASSVAVCSFERTLPYHIRHIFITRIFNVIVARIIIKCCNDLGRMSRCHAKTPVLLEVEGRRSVAGMSGGEPLGGEGLDLLHCARTYLRIRMLR
jgi:hypothetical protein